MRSKKTISEITSNKVLLSLTTMKFSTLLTGVFLGLASFDKTHAAKSFSASNLYYAAGLKEKQQTALLEGLQSAGVKVLRVWLDGMAKAPFQTHH